MFRANNFDKLLDKATSNLRLDPDWPSILQICDLIRQNDCSPKYAVAAIKKKLYSQNPYQAMFALLTLESIVKNCGSGVHDEVASKVFCETLRDLVKTTQHENLKTKTLELIQAWAFAFRNSPKYRAVQDTVNILKAEGHKFPALKESDAMFSADSAPEWADGEVCHRCRVAFSLMVRRHHCRACGQVFCQQCSSKTSTLPKFGIEKEVRVCDACFDKVSRPPSSTAKLEIVDTANDYGPAPAQKRPGKTAEELQEEEELQLALALSQSEAEHKEKERKTRTYIAPESTLRPAISPSPSSVSASPDHSVPNSELSRYLDRNYWEQRISRDTAAAPTAPTSQGTSEATESEFVKPNTSKSQEDEAEDKEIDEFVESLKSQVEIFVNRMKSNSSRGRSIANDTSVQTLFMNITAMHSRLLRYIQQQDDKRVYLESLQDKISQVRDSRAALDTLRAEHAARLAQAAEAAERQRQMQMAAKLQAMRKKKHEYLQYQRQLALQRVQEQEREMQMRQEQQKHQYMMSANSGFYMPGVSMHQFQPGYPNQSMYANPQYHQQMMPQVTSDSPVTMPGQSQMSQANIPVSVSQMGTIAQSMPQINNTYAMTTSGVALTQAQTGGQVPMNQSNLRPGMNQQLPGQQLPMQQHMLMQQMQQMRIPNQPGVHQMMPQNVPNGLPMQGISQQSNQQLSKQNLPNQVQPPNAMIPPMTIGQPGQQTNLTNTMYGMQMPNMRMPMMQGQNQPSNSQSVTGYQMNMHNPQNQQSHTQIPGQALSMTGQPIIQGQGQQLPQAHGLQHPGQGVHPQQQPHMPQGQIPIQQGNAPQSQAVMMQGTQPQGQNIPQQTHMISQGQQVQNQLPNQGQQMAPGAMPRHIIPGATAQSVPHMPSHMHQQMPQPSPQQIPNQIPPQIPNQIPPQIPNQIPQQMPNQVPHQMPNQVPHQMPNQVPQLNQGPQQIPNQVPQSMPNQVPQQMPNQVSQQNLSQVPQQMPSQPMKMPSQNFGNGPPNPQQAPNQQAQQVQTSVKIEQNNNTAELISFD